MKCEAIRVKLSAYMDGELDEAHHREIAGHLRLCPECRQELEELGGVDTLLKGLPRYGPAAGFAEAVVSGVREAVFPAPAEGFLRRAWKAALEYSERFLELLEPEARSGTRSLDEFDDIPASFIGYAYFKAIGLQR